MATHLKLLNRTDDGYRKLCGGRWSNFDKTSNKYEEINCKRCKKLIDAGAVDE